MSQWPRNLRREQLYEKAGLNHPSAGLMDTQTVKNIKDAIEQKLDEQDTEYIRQQAKYVQQIKDNL